MKRKIYDNGAIVRICLLFFYPFGLVLLAMSHIVKHKFLITVMYLVPFVVIGFPIIAAVIGDKMIINSDIYRIIFIFMAVIVFPIAFLSYIVLILQDKTNDGTFKRIFNKLFRKKKNDKEKQIEKAEKTEETEETEETRQQAIEDFRRVIKQLNQEDSSGSHFPKEYEAVDSVDVNQNAEYQMNELLTNREKNFYEPIRLIAEKYDLTVLSKVRLADVVKVGSSYIEQSPEWYTKFNKISRKHVDFALAGKEDLGVKLLIEVDDYTHNRQDRKERDEFVDWVCSEAGVPILHVTEISGLEKKIKTSLHIE